MLRHGCAELCLMKYPAITFDKLRNDSDSKAFHNLNGTLDLSIADPARPVGRMAHSPKQQVIENCRVHGFGFN